MKGKVGHGQWNKIFMEIFGSRLQRFALISLAFLTELCSFQYGLKDLFTLYKLAEKLSLNAKTDHITSRRRAHGSAWTVTVSSRVYGLKRVDCYINHSYSINSYIVLENKTTKYTITLEMRQFQLQQNPASKHHGQVWLITFQPSM